jgi:hypothetical protein
VRAFTRAEILAARADTAELVANVRDRLTFDAAGDALAALSRLSEAEREVLARFERFASSSLTEIPPSIRGNAA